MNKWTILRIIAIIFILLMIALLYFYKQVENKESLPQSTHKMSDETSNWKTYKTEFGFEFKYPRDKNFSNCSTNFQPKELLIYISNDHERDNCNTPGKGMDDTITIFQEKSFRLNDSRYKILENKKILISGKEATQITFEYEEVGDEGEKLLSEPIRRDVYTIIPIKSDISLIVSYDRIYKVKNNSNGFVVSKDRTEFYNLLLKTIHFN